MMLSFSLDKIETSNKVLTFKNTLKLDVKICKDTGFYEVEHPSLGINESAKTIKKLIKEVEEFILMLWDEYALTDPEILAKDAKELRLTLLELVGNVKIKE